MTTLRDAAESATAGVPVVRKLEWRAARVSEQWERCVADTQFGTYEALEWSGGGFGGTIPNRGEFGGRGSLAEAINVCQADYEKRITAALNPDFLSELDTARAEIERLRGERDEAHKAARALTKALVGLTPGGSEYFTRSTVLDDYFADIERCVTVVRERFNSGHQAKIERLGDRRRTGGATHPTPSAHFPSPQESTSHDDRD